MSNQAIKACKEKFSVITKGIRGKSDGSFYLKDLIHVVEYIFLEWRECKKWTWEQRPDFYNMIIWILCKNLLTTLRIKSFIHLCVMKWIKCYYSVPFSMNFLRFHVFQLLQYLMDCCFKYELDLAHVVFARGSSSLNYLLFENNHLTLNLYMLWTKE